MKMKKEDSVWADLELQVCSTALLGQHQTPNLQYMCLVTAYSMHNAAVKGMTLQHA